MPARSSSTPLRSTALVICLAAATTLSAASAGAQTDLGSALSADVMRIPGCVYRPVDVVSPGDTLFGRIERTDDPAMKCRRTGGQDIVRYLLRVPSRQGVGFRLSYEGMADTLSDNPDEAMAQVLTSFTPELTVYDSRRRELPLGEGHTRAIMLDPGDYVIAVEEYEHPGDFQLYLLRLSEAQVRDATRKR